MLDEQEVMPLLNFFQEPVLIVSKSGKIEVANKAAHLLFGPPVEGRHLLEFATTSREAVNAYLKRCAGSGSPILGAIRLRNRDGEDQRFQVRGALLRKSEGDGRIVLRCSATGVREFAQLTRQVTALNDENRKLRRSRAILEESLSHRALMLRELQHRVRNQTQMMLGMVASARREAQSAEFVAFLDGLRHRLLALATVQQLMYTSPGLESLSVKQLLERLCESISDSWPEGSELSITCEEARLPNDFAVPLALIVNELLSNALKHGLRYGPGEVRVDLASDNDDLVLMVSDPGPGVDPQPHPGPAFSGLGLVRGLCRQIGGALSIGRDRGTDFTVRFPQPKE